MNADTPRYRDARAGFDTLTAARDLEAAGIEHQQAENLDDSGSVGKRTALADEINAGVGGWLGSEGALGLRGGWGPIDDHEVDVLIETIYAARRRDTGRLVELED